MCRCFGAPFPPSYKAPTVCLYLLSCIYRAPTPSRAKQSATRPSRQRIFRTKRSVFMQTPLAFLVCTNPVISVVVLWKWIGVKYKATTKRGRVLDHNDERLPSTWCSPTLSKYGGKIVKVSAMSFRGGGRHVSCRRTVDSNASRVISTFWSVIGELGRPHSPRTFHSAFHKSWNDFTKQTI